MQDEKQDQLLNLLWLGPAGFGAFLLLPAAMVRIDTTSDLWTCRAVDVLIGGLCATAGMFGRHVFSKPSKRYRVAAIWLLVSGGLLSWHQLQVQVRWTTRESTLAMAKLCEVQESLRTFRRDTGTIPTADQGLKVLVHDPGVHGWAGPYVSNQFLDDPWGSPLHYKPNGDGFHLWSCGCDGVDGTGDDILLTDE